MVSGMQYSGTVNGKTSKPACAGFCQSEITTLFLIRWRKGVVAVAVLLLYPSPLIMNDEFAVAFPRQLPRPL